MAILGLCDFLLKNACISDHLYYTQYSFLLFSFFFTKKRFRVTPWSSGVLHEYTIVIIVEDIFYINSNNNNDKNISYQIDFNCTI